MTATQIAGVIGGPFSGLLLAMNCLGHLAGWQWLFLAEGIPAVILGGVAARYLPDNPEHAPWLTCPERKMLSARLTVERESCSNQTLRAALSDGNVWLLSLIYFAIVFGNYGIALWLPQILKSFGGMSDFRVGICSAVPFLTAAVVMVVVAKHSDASEERRWHLAISAFVGAIALAVSAAARSSMVSLIAISIAAAGVASTAGPFWTLPAGFLDGTAAAGGIALINSTGNLAGFVGPSVVGLIREATGSFAGGLVAMAVTVMMAGVIAMAMPEVERQLQPEQREAALSESS